MGLPDYKDPCEGEDQDRADLSQRGPRDSGGSGSPCNACWSPAAMVDLDGGFFWEHTELCE